MNTTLKAGLASFATALVLRVGEEIAWPSISRIPFGSPAKLPLLTALTVCVFLVPILFIVGAILVVMGAVKGNK